ncbi:MAG: immunoglobulin domain-containing protein [Phycisphaerae bacterium]|nr:immunoglobulin domain-containing protein [Phycisphaerae bacterium]
MKKTMLCLFAMLLGMASFASAGLIVHYDMDETAGPLTDNVGGQTAVEEATGHVYQAEGMIDKAVGLTDNASWRLSVADSAEVNSLTNNFTISAWIYWDSSIEKTGLNANMLRIFGDDEAWNGDCWSFGVTSASGFLFTKNGVADCYSAAKPVTQDQWLHVAAVVSSATGVEYYLNGALVETYNNTTNCKPSTAALFGIGRANGNGEAQWFPGNIDDLRVYDNVLTAEDVEDLYTAGLTRATVVAPTPGQELVSLTPTLSWTGPAAYIATAYDVSYSTDPNMDDAVTTVTGLTETQYPITTAFENDTVYYWRVDAWDNATKYTGFKSSFRTVPANPVIETQPVTDVVAAGATATLSVVGLNIDEYQWYFNDEIMVGETEATLTIENAQLANEGEYKCFVKNPIDEFFSEVALVLIERQVAHWALDGDLTDTLGIYDAAAGGPLTFEPAKVDDGVTLTGVADPNNIIAVDYSEVLNTNSFAVSVWAKVTGGSGHRAVVSNRNAPAGVYPAGFIIYIMPDNKVSFWLGSNAGWFGFTGPVIENDQWNMFTATYDEQTKEGKLYVNGVVAYAGKLGDNYFYQTNTVNELRIGSGENETEAGNFFFTGQIDDVQMWDYAIDKDMVGQMYADITGETICTGPVEFDSTGPEGVPDCVVDIYDFAAFANNWLADNIITPAN